MKNEYLNEEKYQNSKRKLTFLALIILIIGLVIGLGLIVMGVMKQGNINSKYSQENKINITQQLNVEKQNLETKKTELEAKGIKYNAFASYTDGETYDLYVITKVLDPSFDYCAFDEYKNNSLTTNYCSLKNNLGDISNDFKLEFDSFNSMPFYMFGAFIIIATFIISGSIYMITKRREIISFTAQQVMPVAQEGMEKMAPTMGHVAKEITKGIKSGLTEENDDDSQ